MPRFDALQRASFNSSVFPCDEIEIRGGLRDHVHEYPHNPGGAPEKLGRKLYEIDLVCPFHDTFAKYPDLYPATLDALFSLFDAQLTADLVIPTVGTMRAYAVTWKRKAIGKARSGERVSMLFREDQGADGLDAFISSAGNVKGFVAQSDRFKLAVKLAPLPVPFFDSLLDAINQVLALKDIGDRYTLLLEAKLLALIDVISQFDRLDLMKDPTMWRVADTMHAIWKSSVDAMNDLSNSKRTFSTYRTPKVMTITEISTALYRDATHGAELLQLNAIEDAFAIPTGTPLRYYPLAA